ncbi:MAG: LPXTG cell wall anchor domain-containing protein, partial [Clostridiales bacterium]|nr:LPXTG cell wall anchor domain-containing protein [Clostridiales bacterium]
DKADDKLDAELKKIYDDAIAQIEAADSFTDATIAYEDGREALLAAANAKSQLSIWLVSLLGFETIIGAAILFITKRRKKLRA